MKLTIDNLDGAGARHYTAALDAEHPPRVQRRLNRPAELRAWLATADPQFVVPVAGGRIILRRGAGDKVFTGYLTATPEYEYLGWSERGPAYRYALTARSDEWLLERETAPRRCAFVDRSAGSALKQLAADLLPGAFDVTGVEDVAVLPGYASDPQKSFSEHARELGVLARASYRAHDGTLHFAAVGAGEYELDETAPDFCPDGLKLASPHGVVNDVTLTGYIEPQAHVKDYFLGDGYSLRFNLSEFPFTRSAVTLLDEEYKDPLLRETYWSVTWRAAISSPIASAVRSTALVVTSRSARSFSCWRPCSKGASWPTTACMRRTPGEDSVLTMSSSTSAGNCPLWQCAHR